MNDTTHSTITGSKYPEYKLLETFKSHYIANNTLIRNLIEELGREKFKDLGGWRLAGTDHDFGDFVRDMTNGEYDPDDRWLERYVIMRYDEDVDEWRGMCGLDRELAGKVMAVFDDEDDAQLYFDEMKDDSKEEHWPYKEKCYILEKQEGDLEGWMDTKDWVDENDGEWDTTFEVETIDSFYTD
tara:strand:+ start:57 stop:608 length:552 start_codon:yes stop_codon:yes gene_type:complete